jgi:hypothetical protein
MKSSFSITCPLVVLAAMTLISCKDEITTPPADPKSTLSKAAGPLVHGIENGSHNPNFSAILNGRNEVPPRVSKGRGVAKMHINATGDTIFYFLNVSNLRNLVAAHIHRASPGISGPIVVELYSAAPAGGRAHGRLTEGFFTPADLIGPYAGSVNFTLFLQELHLDSLYVNVHTDDGVAPPNTGTGDFPGGEIRGQLRSGPDGGIGSVGKKNN